MNSLWPPECGIFTFLGNSMVNGAAPGDIVFTTVALLHAVQSLNKGDYYEESNSFIFNVRWFVDGRAVDRGKICDICCGIE